MLRAIPRSYPLLRPASPGALAFVEWAADELFGCDDEPADGVVEEGVALMGRLERRRLVVDAEARCFDFVDMVRVDTDERTIAHELAAGAVAAAIEERREPRLGLLAALDERGAAEPLHRALASVLPAEAVWAHPEALSAAGRRGCGPSRSERIVADLAATWLEPGHVRKIRMLSQRLERWLPYDSLPRASDILTCACADVARDDEAVVCVAAELLEMSARRARPADVSGRG
jgi:hypothetical protein